MSETSGCPRPLSCIFSVFLSFSFPPFQEKIPYWRLNHVEGAEDLSTAGLQNSLNFSFTIIRGLTDGRISPFSGLLRVFDFWEITWFRLAWTTSQTCNLLFCFILGDQAILIKRVLLRCTTFHFRVIPSVGKSPKIKYSTRLGKSPKPHNFERAISSRNVLHFLWNQERLQVSVPNQMSPFSHIYWEKPTLVFFLPVVNTALTGLTTDYPLQFSQENLPAHSLISFLIFFFKKVEQM